MKGLSQLILVISISFVIVLIVMILLIAAGVVSLNKIGDQIINCLFLNRTLCQGG